jgi:hypothetical protein
MNMLGISGLSLTAFVIIGELIKNAVQHLFTF